MDTKRASECRLFFFVVMNNQRSVRLGGLASCSEHEAIFQQKKCRTTESDTKSYCLMTPGFACVYESVIF